MSKEMRGRGALLTRCQFDFVQVSVGSRAFAGQGKALVEPIQ